MTNQGEKRHGQRSLGVEVILFAAVLSTSLAAQAQVTINRSLSTDQVGPTSYVVTCSVEYAGVDPTHYFNVGTNVADMQNGSFQTRDYSGYAELGPDDQRVRRSQAGVWEFEAGLKNKGTMTSSTRYYLNRAPDLGTYIVCEGFGYDKSSSTTLPKLHVVDYLIY